METESDQLNNKIKLFEERNCQLPEHLKKCTSPSRSKRFYENHKDSVSLKNKEYKEKTNYYSKLIV